MEGVELVFRGCTPSTEQSAEHSVARAGAWRAGVAESAEPPELGELAGHDKMIGVEARSRALRTLGQARTSRVAVLPHTSMLLVVVDCEQRHCAVQHPREDVRHNRRRSMRDAWVCLGLLPA